MTKEYLNQNVKECFLLITLWILDTSSDTNVLISVMEGMI